MRKAIGNCNRSSCLFQDELSAGVGDSVHSKKQKWITMDEVIESTNVQENSIKVVM